MNLSTYEMVGTLTSQKVILSNIIFTLLNVIN